MPGHTDHHGDDFGALGWWPHVPPDSERAILLDLITELQSGDWETYDDTDGHKSIRRRGDGWGEAGAHADDRRVSDIERRTQRGA